MCHQCLLIASRGKFFSQYYTGWDELELTAYYYAGTSFETYPEVVTASVIATHSGKQTHSEGRCRQWNAVYYSGGPKAESPFSQGPRPTFVKTLYTLSVLLKLTSPNSLHLAWKMLKGDTIRLQP